MMENMKLLQTLRDMARERKPFIEIIHSLYEDLSMEKYHKSVPVIKTLRLAYNMKLQDVTFCVFCCNIFEGSFSIEETNKIFYDKLEETFFQTQEVKPL